MKILEQFGIRMLANPNAGQYSLKKDKSFTELLKKGFGDVKKPPKSQKNNKRIYETLKGSEGGHKD